MAVHGAEGDAEGEDKDEDEGKARPAPRVPVTPRSWMPAMLLAAALYLVIGIGATELGGGTNTGRILAWRYAAWILSFAVAVVHIGYEHFLRRSTALRTAAHAAGAVA